MVDGEISPDELKTYLNSHSEWLLIRSSGKSFALESREIELEPRSDRLLFGFLDDRGYQTWRINALSILDREVRLDLSRGFGREREKIRLVPRVSAAELGAETELARLERANQLAGIIRREVPGAKLLRVRLNRENGRLAQIVFEVPPGSRILALADVTRTLTHECLMATALLRLRELERRKKNKIRSVWVLAGKQQARGAQILHALLRPEWRSKIRVLEIAPVLPAEAGGETPAAMRLAALPERRAADLWRAKTRPAPAPPSCEASQTARKIKYLAPDRIDIVFSRYGETLRFRGLPFARVRKGPGGEKAWFGIERDRRILTDASWPDLVELLESLEAHRRFDAPGRRHALYRLAPEAWLEAILRGNISLLDANLILSPLYHQFRAGRDRIDLLALRRDGRLVVIELKTGPDREVVFQAVDYWRKIELERRKGDLGKRRLFGDLEIADRPALVYLVAPALSIHPDVKFLASTVSAEVELVCFKISEKWRESFKVIGREEFRSAAGRQ